MPIPAFLIPILSQGLNLIANAAMAKGKDWVKNKTGVDLDKPELTSEDYTKLKQYEMDHEEDLIRLRQEDDKLSFEIEKAYLQDVQNARTMQMAALAQDDIFSKRFVYYFAIFWSIATACYLGFITFGTIPEDNVRFADTILGFVLGTLVSTIIGYFYGSSRGSSQKNEMIQGVLKNVPSK